jgi:hypothetical protein
MSYGGLALDVSEETAGGLALCAKFGCQWQTRSLLKESQIKASSMA